MVSRIAPPIRKSSARRIIPSRGAWLEFEIDKKDQPQVRVDRKRKQSAIVFLMAIGMTKSEIAQAFKDYPLVLDALEQGNPRDPG